MALATTTVATTSALPTTIQTTLKLVTTTVTTTPATPSPSQPQSTPTPSQSTTPQIATYVITTEPGSIVATVTTPNSETSVYSTKYTRPQEDVSATGSIDEMTNETSTLFPPLAIDVEANTGTVSIIESTTMSNMAVVQNASFSALNRTAGEPVLSGKTTPKNHLTALNTSDNLGSVSIAMSNMSVMRNASISVNNHTATDVGFSIKSTPNTDLTALNASTTSGIVPITSRTIPLEGTLVADQSSTQLLTETSTSKLTASHTMPTKGMLVTLKQTTSTGRLFSNMTTYDNMSSVYEEFTSDGLISSGPNSGSSDAGHLTQATGKSSD